MVNNIAVRNKIQNPDLIFPGQKLVLDYERGVTGNFDAVLKDPEKTQNQSLSIRDKGNSENLSLAKQKAQKNQSKIGPLYAQSSIQPTDEKTTFFWKKR